MKLLKKVCAVMLGLAVFATATTAMTASADWMEDGKLQGARWFPVPVEKQNDDAWEVECYQEGCLCQRFTQTKEDTGYSNFLDTVYTDKGGLTLTRNGNDGVDGNYWPRIRTVMMETAPELDLQTANTLYYDFEVAEGTQWNFSISINGMNVSLARLMAEDCGATLPEGPDAPAGKFKGTLNIQDAINEIAADSNHLDNVNAQALKNMKKTFVPQLQVYVVGAVGSSVTIHELYISTPEDTTGANCTFVDMGVLTGFGDEYYELETEEPSDEPAVDEPADEPETEATTPADDSEEETATTTAAGEVAAEKGGFIGWLDSLGGIFSWLAGILDSIF